MEKRSEPQKAPSPSIETMTHEPCRVFLVDDDLDDRIASQRELERCDMVQEVKCFSDGEELIKYMREQGFEDHTVLCMTPTIIIVDLNMPKMGGFKVLERLKSDRFLEEIPVIVLSGVLDYEAIRHALDLRADGVLRKPLNAAKLAEHLKHGWKWPTREMWMM